MCTGTREQAVIFEYAPESAAREAGARELSQGICLTLLLAGPRCSRGRAAKKRFTRHMSRKKKLHTVTPKSVVSFS